MTRQREHFVCTKPSLTPEMRAWFMDDRDVPASACFMTDEQIRELWLAHAAELTLEYAAGWPGTRPTLWWRYSAPGHRAKTGGSGDNAHEVMAYAPTYLIGACVQVNVDPLNPPRFQSEAAYLREHNLLLPGELERLTADDFTDEVPEPHQYIRKSCDLAK